MVLVSLDERSRLLTIIHRTGRFGPRWLLNAKATAFPAPPPVPLGSMATYNSVNGTKMSKHSRLQNEVLRGEWGFDGHIVSD
ncbi:hypothetical protein ACQP1W_33815 [Spirillospora sp. CA-255316]